MCVTSLSAAPGVHSVLVALLAGKAEVQYDPSVLLPSQVAGHITELGFPAQLLENQSPEGTIELEVGPPESAV